MIAASPVQGILTDAETSDAMVIAYAVLLPFTFMIASITGIIAAFGWRPGKVHLAGKNEKKK